MRVNIGPYKSWIGPFQIANLLKYVGVSEDVCSKIGERLGNTKLQDLCEFIESKRTRKIKVHIDKYDTWSMDTTLAHIILPMLHQLRATKHGAPLVDDCDVPEHLRSTSAPIKNNDYDIDANHFLRWDWVLDEMIFAFEAKQDDNWDEQFWSGDHGTWELQETEKEFENPTTGELESTYRVLTTSTRVCDYAARDAMQNRINNGFRLFGVYYQGLWD